MRALDRKLLRDLSRLKVQAAAIALVVAAGVAMFVAMLATYDSIRVSERHYDAEQKLGHVWADLSRAPASVARAIGAIAGVAAVDDRIAEPVILDVPGLEEPASAQLISVPADPEHGVSEEIRENQRRVAAVRVAQVLEEGLGVAVYMDIRALDRLLGEPETYSGVNLKVDPTRERQLYAVLKRTPAAAAVDFRRGALAIYRAMGDAAIEFIRRIEVVFGVVIAFGVAYNTARIALAERARELATLRVLGFTRAEVSRMLLGEIAALAAPAIPLGFGLGYVLSALIVATMDGERMHPELVVYPSTYGFAFLVFFLSAGASALIVRRGLDRLDLIEVLKARE